MGVWDVDSTRAYMRIASRLTDNPTTTTTQTNQNQQGAPGAVRGEGRALREHGLALQPQVRSSTNQLVHQSRKKGGGVS